MAEETMTSLGVETGDFVSFDHGSEQATAAVQPATGAEGTTSSLSAQLFERSCTSRKGTR